MDFVAFHVSFGDVDDVLIIEEFVQQDLFVLVQRTVEIIGMQDDIETREPFDVVNKFPDIIRFCKYIGRKQNDFYEFAFAAKIMALAFIGNQAAGIQRRIRVLVDHLAGLFFTSGVCPKHVVHRSLRSS